MRESGFKIARLAVALFLLSVLGGAAPPATGAGSANIEGQWNGVLLFKIAETEIDFEVDFQRVPNGALSGTIRVPSLSVVSPLQNVKVQGATVSFELHDQNGVRVFTGTLADGVVRGNCVRPKGTIPFEMSRSDKAAASKRPRLEVLASGRQLGPVFERDRGGVRLILLLSPT